MIFQISNRSILTAARFPVELRPLPMRAKLVTTDLSAVLCVILLEFDGSMLQRSNLDSGRAHGSRPHPKPNQTKPNDAASMPRANDFASWNNRSDWINHEGKQPMGKSVLLLADLRLGGNDLNWDCDWENLRLAFNVRGHSTRTLAILIEDLLIEGLVIEAIWIETI